MVTASAAAPLAPIAILMGGRSRTDKRGSRSRSRSIGWTKCGFDIRVVLPNLIVRNANPTKL